MGITNSNQINAKEDELLVEQTDSLENTTYNDIHVSSSDVDLQQCLTSTENDKFSKEIIFSQPQSAHIDSLEITPRDVYAGYVSTIPDWALNEFRTSLKKIT